MPKTLKDLPIGTLLKDPETKYWNEPIIWTLIDKNHNAFPNNSGTLLSKYLLRNMSINSKHSGSDFWAPYGLLDYVNSDIRQWMNSNKVDWFEKKDINDLPPSSVYVPSCPYDAEAGFLTNFSEQLRSSLMVTSRQESGTGIKYEDKVFLLTAMETGISESGMNVGVKFPVFTDALSRTANPSQGAVDHGFGQSTGSALRWWTCTRCAGNNGMINITGLGAADNSYTATTKPISPYGFRPAINISLETMVTDEPDADGIYSILWNQLPNPPPHITVSENVRINKPVTVTWGAASDPDGDSLTYELERSVNAAAYVNIQSSPALSHTETVGADWYTVQYRVRSCDTYSSYSGYTVSQALPVVHNVDPTISGQDSDLGNVTAPPSYTYQVNDTDEADSLTITELLDGRTQRTIANATRNTSYTFALGIEQYIQLRPGQHQLTITVADSNGNSASRNITFTRVVEAIDFELRPRETDALVEKVLVSMRYIGDPNKLQMQVSNNPFDSAPVWEDASPGQKHLFVNTACASGKPGIGLRVRLEPSVDYPEVACFAPSIAFL